MKDSLTFLGHLSLQLLPITLTTIIAFLFLNWVHISLTLHRDVLQIFFSSLLYDLSRYILEGFQCNLNASHLYLVDFSTSELSSSNPFPGSLGLTVTGLMMHLICILLKLVCLEKMLIGFIILKMPLRY